MSQEYRSKHFIGPGPSGEGIHLPHVSYGAESASRFYVALPEGALARHQSNGPIQPHAAMPKHGRRARSKTSLGLTATV